MVHKASILVVDDDPVILETIQAILEDEGYMVSTATNGAEGLDHVAREHPTLVLLDMRMPVLDGWGFARALGEQGIQLPIIVISAGRDTRCWAKEIGANHYLSKPFDLTDLLQCVASVIEG